MQMPHLISKIAHTFFGEKAKGTQSATADISSQELRKMIPSIKMFSFIFSFLTSLELNKTC